MTLAAGVRLGAYEVRAPLGKGGMGEVYRAHDSRLHRDVAIKILPPLVATDPERLARFRREAQVLASLNHPNIAAIYGLEDDGGVLALVLELVEGPTLADRIGKGPIPLDEALPMARQIADALEAAHAQGIVHRDLKPANIKLRPDDAVKVLDFGLAKALSPDSGTSVVTESPTITSPGTLMGVILGTAAYMSPEQARGRAVDKRSDIWAFGAVLFEMLTGRRPFDGNDVSDTLASVLKSDPDWGVLARHAPPHIQRVIRRCLDKDPRRRFHDIADVRFELEESRVAEGTPPLPVSTRRLWLERAAWTLLVAALGGGLAYQWLRPQPTPAPIRYTVAPPGQGMFGTAGGLGGAAGSSSSTLSPDGRHLAFVSAQGTGTSQIWLRALNEFDARPLAGTEGGSLPFWSPDGRHLAYFVAGRLRRIDIASGVSQTICEVPDLPRGGTWGSRDVILLSSGNPATLWQVSARGGQSARLPTPDAEKRRDGPVWPQFLPDGRHFLFWTRSDGNAPAGISVASLDGAFAPRRLVASETQGTYAAPGYLLFVIDGTLMRQRFDLDALAVEGEPTPVAEHVMRNAAIGLGDFSAAGEGVLAFRGGQSQMHQFTWVGRDGRELESVGPPGSYRTPALSPDGTRLAYTDTTDQDLWVLDLKRGTRLRLTSMRGLETCPVWSPDGSRIAFRSDQEGGGLFEIGASGTGAPALLLKQIVNGPSQFSRDGAELLYFASEGMATNLDIFVLPMTGERTPRAVVKTPFGEVEPQWSPDGRWLAYASRDSGSLETFVQPYPPTGPRWQVSNLGGRQPMWRADGRELYFVSDDRKFYAVDVRATDSSFDFGVPQYLFTLRANVFNARNSYVPSPDGQRFLVNTLLDTVDAPIQIVHNWMN